MEGWWVWVWVVVGEDEVVVGVVWIPRARAPYGTADFRSPDARTTKGRREGGWVVCE